VDCLHDYRLAVSVHGDEILNHANWEISVCYSQNPVHALLKSCVCLGKMAQTLHVSPRLVVAEDSKADGETILQYAR